MAKKRAVSSKTRSNKKAKPGSGKTASSRKSQTKKSASKKSGGKNPTDELARIREVTEDESSRRKFKLASFDLKPKKDFEEKISRLNYSEYDLDRFRDEYVKPRKPCVIRGAMDDWQAMQKWQPIEFAKNFPGPIDGRISVKDYVTYAMNDCFEHDRPYYIFCAQPEEVSSELLSDYKVPKYFTDDLFELCPDHNDTPFRWLIIGGARTGAVMHYDPLDTSAWNALIHGNKRWVLFPPEVDPKVIIPDGFDWDQGSAGWFKEVYPDLIRKNRERKLGMQEFIQRPGEVVFLPGRWWHIVLNLDFTVCVTQNFCDPGNLDVVFSYMKRYAKTKARRLYRNLPEDLQNSLDLSDFDPSGSSRSEWDPYFDSTRSSSSKSSSGSGSGSSESSTSDSSS